MPVSDMHPPNKGENRSIVKLVVTPSGEENDTLMNHYYVWESASNSPSGHTGILTSDISCANFTCSSSCSSSCDSGGFYYGIMTEEDDDEDGCLDDWEAMADALPADETKCDHTPDLDPEMHDHSPQLEPLETIKDDQVHYRASVNHRAWTRDDCFRPQGLPNLLKRNSFPLNSERSHGGTAWGFKNVGPFTPTTCPICCEDLDLTDSSFLPCPCGYRLCLLCYKRILEDIGWCPGCMKQYEQFDQGNTTSKWALSYNMIARR